MKQCLNPDRDESGFTFIELLVVIAIIGIIAALLLTAVSMANKRALRIQCANNVQQLGTGLQAFLTDNNFYPLFIDPSHGAWAAELQHTELSASGNSAKRINFSQWASQGVWKCPAAHKPSNLPPHVGYFSYGYNSYGLTQPMDTISFGLGGHNIWDPQKNPAATNFPAPPVRESEVANPSQMMAIGDDFYGGNGVVHDGGLLIGRTSGLQDYYGSTGRSYARHQGKANVVFCDGHVEPPTLESLFVETNDTVLVRWNRDHLPHRERL
jgi:prepilin-type processing-associated H-X9-DG protein/prepilin-type N-terminal cleavage/methylation domain-containing protein